MRKYGFTLIELLIVITILVTVLGLGIASFTTFNRRERLKQTALTLKSYLRFSQTKAISAQKPLSGCTTYQGMHISFTSTSYSMQHQCIPEGVVGSSESITLPVGVTFSPIPSAFTFLTRSNTDTIITDTAIRLTNGILSYSLVISPNGGVRNRVLTYEKKAVRCSGQTLLELMVAIGGSNCYDRPRFRSDCIAAV